jgi:hypothetical protein
MEVAMDARGQQRLEAVRERLDGWRRRRGGRGRRIPEGLWREAASAAQLAGIGVAARVLRLRPEKLRARAVGPEAAARLKRQARPTFVELSGLGTGEQKLIELTRGGAVMRIQLSGPASTADLLRLAEAFWGGRS